MAIYSVYLRESGQSFATTNMVSLSGISGIGYEKLIYHFTRKEKSLYKTDELIIIKSKKLIKCQNRGTDLQ